MVSDHYLKLDLQYNNVKTLKSSPPEFSKSVQKERKGNPSLPNEQNLKEEK